VAAAVFLGAVIVLAFGVRTESGIVGTSILGKVALILCGLATFAMAALSTIPAPTLDSPSDVTELYVTAGQFAPIVADLALIVASAVVIRANVVSGVARWSLPTLAIWLALELLLARVPFAGWVVAAAGVYTFLALQILAGALFVLQAQSWKRQPATASGVS
jgi:hypothetical protein